MNRDSQSAQIPNKKEYNYNIYYIYYIRYIQYIYIYII